MVSTQEEKRRTGLLKGGLAEKMQRKKDEATLQKGKKPGREGQLVHETKNKEK